jgi:hypothetical protein
MFTRTFDELYPPALLAEREARLRAFWAGTGARAAVTVNNGAYAYRQIEDDDAIVENAVAQILTSADLSDDYLPWFGPDFGTVSTAQAWGGEVVYPEGGCVFIKPVIFGPDDVDRVWPADPAGGHVARAIALAARVKARLGTDRIWCRAIDLQGPLSTAGLLWEQGDFFCSMLSDPDAVHRLLDRVTEHLIGMYRAMIAGMGPLCGMVWPYVWLPDDLGVVFTEDLMPLLSPALYKEFGLPYMTRLAEAFGGAFIHCCGAFEQHIPVLAESGAPILGFDYAEPSTRTEALYEAFGARCVYNVGLDPQGEALYGDYPTFYTHLAKVALADMRFWFCIDASWPGSADRIAAARRLFLDG